MCLCPLGLCRAVFSVFQLYTSSLALHTVVRSLVILHLLSRSQTISGFGILFILNARQMSVLSWFLSHIILILFLSTFTICQLWPLYTSFLFEFIKEYNSHSSPCYLWSSVNAHTSSPRRHILSAVNLYTIASVLIDKLLLHQNANLDAKMLVFIIRFPFVTILTVKSVKLTKKITCYEGGSS